MQNRELMSANIQEHTDADSGAQKYTSSVALAQTARAAWSHPICSTVLLA